MQIKLHPKQFKVAKDEHRFKVVCAGRRWGKSTLARMMMLKWASDNAGLYWIVNPVYQQGKDAHWNQGFKREIPPNLVKRWNDSELFVELKNGSMIQLKSADKPDRMRGVKLRGLIVDEIAAMRNWDHIWKEVLRPTLTDYKSPAVFISTPKGFNHFFKLFETGRTGSEEYNKTYKSWQFTSYDNPYLPKEELDDTRKEYTNALGKVSDYWFQEYMAEFRRYTGLIYKQFNPDVHVINQFDIPKDWKIIRGFDFGQKNPTAVVWIALDGNGNWFVIDEHYESERTIDYHAGIVNANPYSLRTTISYGDPSAAQELREYPQRGIFITPANKERSTKHNNWVRYGIQKVDNLLKTTPGYTVKQVASENCPKFFVFKHCENVLREFSKYKWKEKPAGKEDINEPDIPEKAHDHSMDAIRYCVVSVGKSMEKDINYKFPKEELFDRQGFYQ